MEAWVEISVLSLIGTIAILVLDKLINLYPTVVSSLKLKQRKSLYHKVFLQGTRLLWSWGSHRVPLFKPWLLQSHLSDLALSVTGTSLLEAIRKKKKEHSQEREWILLEGWCAPLALQFLGDPREVSRVSCPGAPLNFLLRAEWLQPFKSLLHMTILGHCSPCWPVLIGTFFLKQILWLGRIILTSLNSGIWSV